MDILNLAEGLDYSLKAMEGCNKITFALKKEHSGTQVEDGLDKN